MFIFEIVRLLRTDENGQSILEYGLILLLVTLSVMVALNPVGVVINDIYRFIISVWSK